MIPVILRDKELLLHNHHLKNKITSIFLGNPSKFLVEAFLENLNQQEGLMWKAEVNRNNLYLLKGGRIFRASNASKNKKNIKNAELKRK